MTKIIPGKLSRLLVDHPGAAADIGGEDLIDGKVDAADKGAVLAYEASSTAMLIAACHP